MQAEGLRYVILVTNKKELDIQIVSVACTVDGDCTNVIVADVPTLTAKFLNFPGLLERLQDEYRKTVESAIRSSGDSTDE